MISSSTGTKYLYIMAYDGLGSKFSTEKRTELFVQMDENSALREAQCQMTNVDPW